MLQNILNGLGAHQGMVGSCSNLHIPRRPWVRLSQIEELPLPSTSPVSFLMDTRKEQAAGFLPMVRSDVAKGKSSHSGEPTQRCLCKETNGLRRSEHNPWQGSASAR